MTAGAQSKRFQSFVQTTVIYIRWQHLKFWKIKNLFYRGKAVKVVKQYMSDAWVGRVYTLISK